MEDWAGGTRISASLHNFNKLWGRRVLGQGAIVLLIITVVGHGIWVFFAWLFKVIGGQPAMLAAAERFSPHLVTAAVA